MQRGRGTCLAPARRTESRKLLLQPDRTPGHTADVSCDSRLVEPGIHHADTRRSHAGPGDAAVADRARLIDAGVADTHSRRAHAGSRDTAVARRARLVDSGVAGTDARCPDAAIAYRTRLVDAGVARVRADRHACQYRDNRSAESDVRGDSSHG